MGVGNAHPVEADDVASKQKLRSFKSKAAVIFQKEPNSAFLIQSFVIFHYCRLTASYFCLFSLFSANVNFLRFVFISKTCFQGPFQKHIGIGI